MALFCIYPQLCQSCSNPRPFPEDLKKSNMNYLQGYTNLLSTAVFWWMNWVFNKGYKDALELSDLGTLSHNHTARFHRNLFEKALAVEEVRYRSCSGNIYELPHLLESLM